MKIEKKVIYFQSTFIMKFLRFGILCMIILLIEGFALAEDVSEMWKECFETFEDGHYFQAHKMIDNLLKEFPDNLEYLIMKAKCLVWTNQQEEALPCWKQMLEQYPNNTLLKAEWALTLIYMNRNEEALKVIDSLDSTEVEKNFRILHRKVTVLAATDRVNSPELFQLIQRGLVKSISNEHDPSNLDRNFLLLAGRLFCKYGYYDVTDLTFTKLCDKYPHQAIAHLNYAKICFFINPRATLKHVLKAQQCPDFSNHLELYYETIIPYYYEIESDIPKTLMTLESADKTIKLPLKMKLFQFALESQGGYLNTQKWEFFLKNSQPQNDEDAWYLFNIQMELFRLKKEWKNMLDYAENHSQYREIHEEDYLVMLLYAKYMLDRQGPPSDEKTYFMKYHQMLKLSISPAL